MDVIADATDPKRPKEAPGESEAKFRLLFQKSPDAMLLLDGDVFIDCNQAAVEMMGCSSKKQLLALHPYDISPERQPDGRPSVEKARELIDRAHRGGSLRFEWVHRRMDGQDFPAEVLLTAIPLHGGQILHVSLRDITERVLAWQTLEQRIEERTRELSTLLEISRNVASTLELEPLLGLILDQLKAVVDYDGASILALEGDTLEVLAYRGPIPREEALELRFPLERAGVNREVIRRGEPVIVPDVRGDMPLGRAFRATAGDQLTTTFGYIRSWMGVPLMAKGWVIGMLTLDHNEPNYYSPREAELVLAFTNQAAMAIENARLFQAEQRRAEQFRMINELGRRISSVLDLDELLWAVVHLIKETFGYYNVNIFLVDPETDELVLKAGVGGYVSSAAPLEDRLKIGQEGILGWIAATGEPLLVNDVSREPRYYATPTLPHTRSELGVPIKVRGRVLGTLDVQSTELNAFDQDDLTTLQTMADQIGVAVENARLFAQAERSAAVAERSRLARDLHDAVTQTLFSASLIAEVLPRLWERNPEEGLRRLEELRELTRGALAEMRTLLLELRPSALAEAELGDLLRQLAESITGRARVPVTLAMEGQRPLPPEVKVALYRVAQEALNNMAKHAGASQATLNLRCLPEQLELHVSDDGRGFDLEGISAESLGLGIMRERAEAIGAALEIQSRPGEGTRVMVVWQDKS